MKKRTSGNKKSTNSGIFRRISGIKQPEALAEIGRAHLIIVLLSACLIMTLFILLTTKLVSPALINTAAILIGLTGLFSFTITLSIFSQRMK